MSGNDFLKRQPQKTLEALTRMNSVRDLGRERAQPIGDAMILDFGNGSERFLFVGDYRRDILDGLILGHFKDQPPTVTDNLAKVLLNLSYQATDSPAAHYALGAIISGVNMEKTRLRLGRKERNVLVFPQADRRVATNVASMKALSIANSLADEHELEAALVEVAARSQWKFPYTRIVTGADIRGKWNLKDKYYDTLACVLTTTFNPQDEAPYNLRLAPERVMIMKQPLVPDPIGHAKYAGRYPDRIANAQTVLSLGYDAGYCLLDGTPGDRTCKNMAMVSQDPSNPKNVKIIFNMPTQGEMFIGRTQTTLIDIGDAGLLPENITVAVIHDSEGLAREAWYENSKGLTGKALVKNIFSSHRISYMAGIGTYEGIGGISEIVLLDPEGQSVSIKFTPDQHVRDALNTVKDTFVKTVFGVEGGTRLTADGSFCRVYDLEEAQEGNVVRIDLTDTKIKDVSKRYTPKNLNF